MIFDDANNNNLTIQLLTNTLCCPILNGAFFYTKYAYHILNLIVRAGLGVEPIDKFFDKYKEALRFIDWSVKKNSYFGDV